MSDSAVLVRRSFPLPKGARLRRITMQDKTSACIRMHARLIPEGAEPANPQGRWLDLISFGSAELSEDLSWEGDLPCDGLDLVFLWQGSTLADELIAKALVEFP